MKNQARMHTVENGVSIYKDGFPDAPLLFCDDRLMFEMHEDSISEIQYFSRNCSGNSRVLQKNFFNPFVFYLENDTASYSFRPTETQVSPYGFTAEWPLPDTTVTLSITAVQNSVCIRLQVPETFPQGYRFKFEIVKNGFFMPLPFLDHDFRSPQKGGQPRVWRGFTFEEQRFAAAYTEGEGENAYDIAFSLGADFRLGLRKSPVNKKFSFSSDELKADQTYHVSMSFAMSQDEANAACTSVLADMEALLQDQKQRYAAVAEKAPILHCSNQSLSDFLALAPMYNESLKMLDCAGAIRANTKHYFAWGCDSLFHGNSLAYWGDNAYNGDILELAKRVGSP